MSERSFAQSNLHRTLEAAINILGELKKHGADPRAIALATTKVEEACLWADEAVAKAGLKELREARDGQD